MRANAQYYLGAPSITRIVLNTFPSVRAAWAELLRGHIDMLYEVGVDALDSLEKANDVSVYTFTRPYQYGLVFNTQSQVFKSNVVRQALGLAIDRNVVVRSALGGHG